MKKQAGSKKGYSKKDLIKVLEKIDSDRHQQKINSDMQKQNSKIRENVNLFR